jgi:hypothetical protein
MPPPLQFQRQHVQINANRSRNRHRAMATQCISARRPRESHSVKIFDFFRSNAFICRSEKKRKSLGRRVSFSSTVDVRHFWKGSQKGKKKRKIEFFFVFFVFVLTKKIAFCCVDERQWNDKAKPT